MADEGKQLLKELFPNAKVGASFASAGVLGLILLIVTILMSPDRRAWAFNGGILVLGVCAGWLMGIVVSPYDVTEQKQFFTFGKALSVFASGYLIGKVDKLTERVLSPDFLLNPVVVFHVMIFLSAFLISLVVTFVARRYLGAEQ